MLRDVIKHIRDINRKFVLLVFILIGIFLIGTVGYMLTKDISFIDGVKITLESLAFIHENETGGARFVQVSLVVFGMFFIWFALWTLMDIVLEGHFNKYFSEVKTMQSLRRMKNHYVICGSGRVGMHAADMLAKKRVHFVLIERDNYLMKEATKKGYHVVEGNALEESVLKEVGIERAKGILAVLPETEKNILVILTAKELNPHIVVYARCSNHEHIKRLKKAGADYVFLPELTCAEDIVETIANEKPKILSGSAYEKPRVPEHNRLML